MLPGHSADFPRFSEECQQAFFASALDAARAAEAAAGAVSHDYVIAGTRIRLVFAGPGLAALLTPALAHRLERPEGAADCTLHLWDSASTGVEMAPPPFGRHCFSERGDIWGFESRRIKSAFDQSDCSLHLFDVESRTGVFWVQDARALPYWTRAAPLRALLSWMLGEHGGQLVHAAAVGTADGAVLIAGKGGIGKSTTALECLAAGFDLAGDDYVLLTGGDAPMVHSLYRTAKVNPDIADRFAALAPDFAEGRPAAGGGKGVILLGGEGAQAGRLVPAMPLRAILTAGFGSDAGTFVEPVDPALLVGAATYTCLAQLPRAGREAVDFIARLVAGLPGGRLVLGTELNSIPAALAAYLAEPASVPWPTAPDEDMPLVSVVIPVRNGAHFIGEAVDSLLAQRLPKLEIVIVDDDSDDRLEVALAALPVQVRKLRVKAGSPSLARNLGARASTGDYLAFLDVDDRWAGGAWRAMLAHLQATPGAGVAIGRSQVFDAADERASFMGSPAEAFPFSIGAALYRRSAFEAVGPFDPALRYGEDLDWFARARSAGVRLDRLEMVTLHVGRHGGNMTRDLTGIELLPLQLARNALKRKRIVAEAK